VAERLGVPLDDVRVRFGDTRSAPYGMGTFASRSAVLGGGAAWKAADAVRDTLTKIAARVMAPSSHLTSSSFAPYVCDPTPRVRRPIAITPAAARAPEPPEFRAQKTR
jgi:CO/xanthine dehydrogenase Mo-binding subunit